MIMEEMWKEVELDPRYKISSYGRVKSERGILKPQLDSHGYYHVIIKRKTMKIHRLVTLAFLGPKPKNIDVCHNDGDKSNNRLDNLRYDTRKGNLKDKWKHGTAQAGENNPTHKLTLEQVEYIKSSNESINEMAKRYGVSINTIGAIRREQNWGHTSHVADSLLEDQCVIRIKEMIIQNLSDTEISKKENVSRNKVTIARVLHKYENKEQQ